MPTRKIGNLPRTCRHPDHDPPNMAVYEDGVYEHECPSCGHKQVFTVNKPSQNPTSRPYRSSQRSLQSVTIAPDAPSIILALRQRHGAQVARRAVSQQTGPRRMITIGVTFPVELEEREASLLDQLIREKFMPERVHQQIDTEAERLLHKVHRVLNRFRDKRTADEEFAASLTDEEREIIRARRAQRPSQEAIDQAIATGISPTGKP